EGAPNLRLMALVTNVIQGSNAERLLLLVHGYGADERDLGGILPYLDAEGQFAVVLPRGALPAAGTPGFMWYEFGAAGDAIRAAAAELDALVEEQCGELGLDRAQAIFGGFSQGGGLALALGLHSENAKPAGILAMSPASAPPEIDDSAREVPVL